MIPMKRMMTTMRITRADGIPIALLSAASLSVCAANLLLNVQPFHMAFTLIGVCAYAALARLGDYDPHLLCDTIQSGEAAVGTLALCAVALFVTTEPYLLTALAFLALLTYQVFMKAVLAPVRKEIALSGMAAQSVLAVMAMFVVAGGYRTALPMAGTVFTGYFSALTIPAALPAASLTLAVAIPIVLKALNPELRLLSQGMPFSRVPARSRIGAASGVFIARSLLATMALLFAGWTCGIGISVRRLHRGALPDAVMVLSLVCLGQIALLIDVLSGPLPAAAASWACSYAVFSLYCFRRVHLYDRYQQS
jgi:hypothetical protein